MIVNDALKFAISWIPYKIKSVASTTLDRGINKGAFGCWAIVLQQSGQPAATAHTQKGRGEPYNHVCASKGALLWCTTTPADCERQIKWQIPTADDRSRLQRVLALLHRPLLKGSLEINFMPDLVQVVAWMHLWLIPSIFEPFHLALNLTTWKRK